MESLVALLPVSLLRVRRLPACLLLACSILVPSAAHAAEWDVEQLMQALAKAKPGRATFVERKFISMLERPVESSGELQYAAPDRLEKRTIKPRPENMVVEGDTLILERGKQKHTVKLQEYPELNALIASIRGTLSGDRKALERVFKLKLEGSAERWTLQMLPVDAAVGRSVHLVRISGANSMVRMIDVIQTDGDRTEMSIEALNK